MTSLSDRRTVVVVGAGLAGARTVEALRDLGYDGRLVLMGAEGDLPYVRPPLSKEYLRGEAGRDSLDVLAPHWYGDHDVDVRVETTVSHLDPWARTVTCSDGSRQSFDAVALTTGSRPRRLQVAGADSDGVVQLRSRQDSEALREALPSLGHLVIVGGGWIGLEVAAAARSAGVDVTVLEQSSSVLPATGPELAEILSRLHDAHGATLRTGVQVEAIQVDGRGRASGVRLADGTTIEADLVLAAVGAVPNDELAADARLTTDDGVVTDPSLSSSHPDVYAAGDVARALHPRTGRFERVEHWANAEHQPRTMAASMLGMSATYTRLPYFFSDQYDLSFELVGFVRPGDYDMVVTRGAPDSGRFAMFWVRSGRLVAGLTAGDYVALEELEQLVTQSVGVGPETLTDHEVDLSSLVTHPVEDG